MDVFGNLTFSDNGKYVLTIHPEGFTYVTNDGKKNFAVNFSDVRDVAQIRYLDSNVAYNLIFRGMDGQELANIDTDVKAHEGQHNIKETKSLLTAFAAYKLTNNFPTNIDSLNVTLGFTLGEKDIRLENGVISGKKHRVSISDIRRVKCMPLGTLLVYTKEKGGFFDFPDIKVPANSLTVPLLEAIVTRNTGHGIDFSQGNGYDLPNSEHILIRYMDPDFFLTDNLELAEDWQKICFNRANSFGYAVRELVEN
ncbi:hypothetical protein EJ419_01840 [Alloscardovia theropitheci]|uniref:Uncharacterized protein n=2 Tax=Alloscardovia theropitheci TaxID=2496842 RepID=A0A4R0QU40_9BIFI|nr:hypothetical protein EJ419_01840 [Alloscardovia theropitheci]